MEPVLTSTMNENVIVESDTIHAPEVQTGSVDHVEVIVRDEAGPCEIRPNGENDSERNSETEHAEGLGVAQNIGVTMGHNLQGEVSLIEVV